MKRSKKQEPLLEPSWHPNFRDSRALPDLKVIRTDFLVNIVSISLAACVLLFLGFREYQAYNLKSQISTWEAKIDHGKIRNRELLRQSHEFFQYAKKIEAVETFTNDKFVGSDFLVNLTKTLPDAISLAAVDYKGKQVVLSGAIQGASDAASAQLSTYVRMLKGNSYFKSVFGDDINITSLSKDAQALGLNFQITMKFPVKKARAHRRAHR